MSKKVFNMQGGKHSAAAYSELEKWAYGSCVASVTSFVVSAGTGMNLNISTGAGIISDSIARRIGTDATETATVSAASATYNRIDAVVAYIDTAVAPTTTVTDNTNDILKFVVVAGTAAASPVAPNDSAIQSAIGAGKPFMRLYNVTVPQNATNTSGMTFADQRVFMRDITSSNIPANSITTTKLVDGVVTTAKIADGAVTYAKTDGSIWWQELGRQVVTSATTSVSIPITTKKHLKIIVFLVSNYSGNGSAYVRANNNAGSTDYRRRFTYNTSSTVSALSNDSSFFAALGYSATGEIAVGELTIANASSTSQEKIAVYTVGSVTDTRSGIGQMKSTSAITSIQLTSENTNGLGIGTSIVVLGHD